jgi:penicillin-binding protein 1A
VVYLKRLLRLALVLAAISGVLAGALVLAAPQARTVVSAHHSDHEQLTLKPLAQRSYIYDSKGNEQGVMTNRENPQNRVTVSLDKIPEPVIESILAVEDANFYRHKGVNIRSIARAVDANLESGGVSQGGSTITQQVVKNSLVGDDRDFSRKIREAFLAVELEKQMEKDEILEYYLNSVNFGGGAYGVQAAAELYYDKDVSELDWAEGAMLAALIASPNGYNPVRHPDRAKRQRTLAFRRLVETGKLTREEADFADAFPLPTKTVRPAPPYDYFLDYVQEELLKDPKYGLGRSDIERNRNVYEGGIKVYTTFDPDMQAKAVQARDETMPDNNGDGTFTVTNPETGQPEMGTQAIASVEPSSGAVRVMVGGPGFDRVQFNITTSGRQPGSTMKTFVAASLFEQGYTPQSTLSGSCTFKWPDAKKPGSKTTTYAGKLGSIQSMLSASSNCGFVGLGQAAGLDAVADLTERVGVRKSSLYTFDSEGQPNPLPYVLPLGTENISPLEMATAYATFANDGFYNEPYLIERIEDSTGRVIYQHRSQPRRVVDETTARYVTQVLETNVRSGTGTRARIASGQPAGGKTGTTDNATDLWFVGYTPQLSTAVWMGVPVGSVPLERRFSGAFGGRFPAATWGRYYSLLMEGQPIVDFLEPVTTARTKSIPRPELMSGGFSRSSGSGTGTTRRNRPSTTTPTTTPPGNGGGGGGGADDDDDDGGTTGGGTPGGGTTPAGTTPGGGTPGGGGGDGD